MDINFKKLRRRSPQSLLYIWVVLALSIAFPALSYAQNDNYEEISVTVNVQGIGSVELPAIIQDDNKLCLPIVDIFNFLKIKTTAANNFDSVYGFFINQGADYLIDKPHNMIVYAGKTYNLTSSELIKTETNLYLNSDYLGKIFSLECVFNFRSLFVNITTSQELPLMREKRQEMMRMNINKLRGEIPVDTNLIQRYPFAHFGMIDWSVVSTQQIGALSDTRIGLGLGQILAGGEVTGRLNISTGQTIREKDQFYLWRRVNNNSPVLRQIMMGKIATQTVSSIFAPVVGIQLSNSPTTVRKSYATYAVKDFTKPGWIVELYVNNVLVDFKRADSSGFFKFDVPLVYGNSLVRLKFYGPFGEESYRQESISIPFYFLPPKQFEYNVSGGLVEDDSNSKFSKASFGFGISKHFTIGTGVEYMSSIISGNTIPYFSSSLRVGNNLLLSGEYDLSVRTKGELSYRTASSLQFDVHYTKYDEGQKAILNSALEERKFILSVPLKGNKVSLYSLFTFNQTIFTATKYNTAEWLMAGIILGFNIHLSTYGVFIDQTSPYIYSSLSTSVRLPKNLLFTPEIQYDYSNSQLISAKGLFEKHLFRHGFLGLSLEQNFKSDFYNAALQFRYDLSFAQFGFASQFNNNNLAFQQSAKGSLMYDRKSKYLDANNSVSVGRGGVVLRPFLDLNCDGKWDSDEPKVSGLKVNINGGHVQPEDRDTAIRILDMEPYTKYYIELSKYSFDNIAWQIKKHTISVTIVPNMFRELIVPISVVAEANGTVYLVKNRVQKGISQVYVCFYKGDSLVAKTLSEPDGYFSYIGLPPGEYTAAIDTAQLRRINMIASKPLQVHIQKSKDGDLVEGLEFILRSANEPTTSKLDTPKTLDNKVDTTKLKTSIDSINKNKKTNPSPKKSREVKPGGKKTGMVIPHSQKIDILKTASGSLLNRKKTFVDSSKVKKVVKKRMINGDSVSSTPTAAAMPNKNIVTQPVKNVTSNTDLKIDSVSKRDTSNVMYLSFNVDSLLGKVYSNKIQKAGNQLRAFSFPLNIDNARLKVIADSLVQVSTDHTLDSGIYKNVVNYLDSIYKETIIYTNFQSLTLLTSTGTTNIDSMIAKPDSTSK